MNPEIVAALCSLAGTRGGSLRGAEAIGKEVVAAAGPGR